MLEHGGVHWSVAWRKIKSNIRNDFFKEQKASKNYFVTIE